MALEGGREESPRGKAYGTRFATIDACIPAPRLTNGDPMAGTRNKTAIELDRLTGVSRAESPRDPQHRHRTEHTHR